MNQQGPQMGGMNGGSWGMPNNNHMGLQNMNQNQQHGNMGGMQGPNMQQMNQQPPMGGMGNNMGPQNFGMQ